MRVLVACERYGVVRDAFLEAGHDAWSCDLEPSTGNHLQCDVLTVLGDGWDLLIAHPPCTYLSGSGLHWTKRGKRPLAATLEALEFVEKLCAATVARIAIENPVGFLSRAIRRPDQIIQPYDFGDDASKATCLWLKNLPLLRSTKKVEPRYVSTDNRGAFPRWANQTDSGQNRLGPSETRALERARTYPGIASAMADQWGNLGN